MVLVTPRLNSSIEVVQSSKSWQLPTIGNKKLVTNITLFPILKNMRVVVIVTTLIVKTISHHHLIGTGKEREVGILKSIAVTTLKEIDEQC